MGGQKAAIVTQVGQFYFGAVGQFCVGGDSREQTNKFLANCCLTPINHEPPAILGELEAKAISPSFSICSRNSARSRQRLARRLQCMCSTLSPTNDFY